MRLTPFAVWAHKLPKEELKIAVKLQTLMTHSNEIAIETSYLYCYAIGLLINGASSNEAFNKTKDQVVSTTIKDWFEKEIEAPDTTYLTPA
jgi:ADP-ribosylglycohydrolase